MSSVKISGSQTIVLGSRVRIRQPGLLPATWTVVALIPGKSFAWVHARMGLRLYADHELESAGPIPRVIQTLVLSGSAAWLVRRLFGQLMQRYLDQEVVSLKEYCEAS